MYYDQHFKASGMVDVDGIVEGHGAVTEEKDTWFTKVVNSGDQIEMFPVSLQRCTGTRPTIAICPS